MSENLFFSRDTKVFIGLDKIKSLRIQTRGVAYTSPPTLAFSGGGGSGAAATAVIGVSTVAVSAGGSGYSSAPAVTVTGGGGSGAVLTATVSEVGTKAITAFNIISRGTGYTSVPTVVVDNTGTDGSSGAGTIVLGVADVTVTNEGSGYTSTPTVGLTGGGSPSTTAVIKAGAGIWEIPVLDGFSVSQGTNTSEITLNEASDTSGNSLRGRQMFTDSYAPAEWSFSTYARPFIASGTVAAGGADNVTRHHAVEEVLWALMAGNAGYIAPVEDSTNTGWSEGLHNTLASPNNDQQFIDFVDTNKTDLGTCQIYFNLGESSTESKVLALPTHSDTHKITTGGTLVGGSVVTILSMGTTSLADLRTLFGDNTGTYVVGQKVTNASGNRVIPAGNTVVALSAGASNARLFLPDVTGIEVGDIITFSHTDFSTRTVLEIDPTNDGGLSDFQMIQMNAALIVPDETVVTFSRRITYKVEECCVNEASIDFDIDGIATINWSGLGKLITEAVTPTATVYEGTTSTSNMIRNRLTSMTIQAADFATFPGDSDADGTYNLVLTGGNVTISNNMTYLTPETTGMVNQPLEHVTGTRSVSGSFTTYLDKTVGGSADLFEDIIEATTSVTNSFATIFQIGGDSSTAPNLKLTMANCHLEVPTHSLDDVIGLEVNFHALPSTVSGTDELTVAYKGA